MAINVPTRHCTRCHHGTKARPWILRGTKEPAVCPKCKTPYWPWFRGGVNEQDVIDSGCQECLKIWRAGGQGTYLRKGKRKKEEDGDYGFETS